MTAATPVPTTADPQNPQPGDVFALDPRASDEYSVWSIPQYAEDYPARVRCVVAYSGTHAQFVPEPDPGTWPTMYIPARFLSPVGQDA